MQVRFEVDLTHDDPKESLIIVAAHPEGTHLTIPFEKFVIPPRQLVERTLAIFEWYLPDRELHSKAARESVEFSHQIQLEDVAICERVQKNLHSRSYERGRYSVKQERGVHAFHRMYAEAMKEAPDSPR